MNLLLVGVATTKREAGAKPARYRRCEREGWSLVHFSLRFKPEPMILFGRLGSLGKKQRKRKPDDLLVVLRRMVSDLHQTTKPDRMS